MSKILVAIDDKNIIDNLQKGNEKALKLLYDRFFPSLCSYAYKFVSDEMLAADIVQEVYIKFWDKRKDFFSFYSIRSFMYISVKNTCINSIRDNKKTIKVDISEDIPFDEDNLVIEEEVHRMIDEEIDKLPEAMRKVFNLTLMDMSIPEIASALNLSQNTVRNQRARAREILKHKLKDWFFLFFI